MITLNRALFIGALMGVAAAANAAPSIVYSNLTTVTAASYRMASGAANSLEMGDQVALAGSDRRIRNIRTTIQVQGTGLGAYDFDVAIRFRNLDGTTPVGGPNTQIGSTLNYQIRGLAEGAGGTAAAWIFNFGVPDILVPNNLLVSYQFTRVGGNTGGVGLQFTNDAAEVGASDSTFFWRETTAGSAATGGWSTFNFGATPNGNLVQEITAVPEPATMAVLGLGAAALVRRRRSKKS